MTAVLGLLREAVQRHLLQLASERDAETWSRLPLSAEEQSLTAVADWGPAEDWADVTEAGPLHRPAS